ncbi:MAG: hypothetical protein MJ179_11025 [Treponema sp.]|nr:hypothetical protein [Treponema sp.]
MKKIFISILFLISILNFANAKSLVVFYSLTGTTKAMAERIAEETGSDIFELQLVNPYSLNGTKCSDESKADRKNNTPRKIKSVPDLSKYDTIFAGTPVWNDYVANPVETWLLSEQKNLAGKTVVPFCTYWSTGNKETLKAIGDLSSSKKVKEGLSQAHGEKADIKKWIKKIGL